MKGFSIIICCYNSEKVLPRTLAHLAALHLIGGIGTELIVVDNCCTDNTVAVAHQTWADCHAPVKMKVVREDMPGLSAARRKGIQTACYEYLLFCDDDNWLAPDYLEVAYKLFSEHKQTGMLGGLGMPVYEQIPDYWPEDFYIYGSGPQAADNGKPRTLHGAAVFLRKSAFNRLKEAGFHFILSDRKGDQLTSGGDYELCYAIALTGYEIRYHNTLKFSHYIGQERVTWDYCRKFIRESAPAVDVLDVYGFILRYGGKRQSMFYLQQTKYIFYHIKKILQSAYLKHRYPNDKIIYFLETFHHTYHANRIILIFKGLFRYHHYLRKVIRLKAALDSIRQTTGDPLFRKVSVSTSLSEKDHETI